VVKLTQKYQKRGPGFFDRAGRWFRGLFAMVRNFKRLTPAQKRRTVLLCAVPVLAVVVLVALPVSLLLARGTPLVESQQQQQAVYEQSEYEREAAQFADLFLPKTDDAGEEYLQETLFVGDSNTVRLANFGEIEMNSMAAVVGMGVQSVPGSACIWFAGYDNPVTMPKAAALLQPRRMIVMFGTNNTDMDTDDFVKAYQEALDALQKAYPYADLIIASIPPVGANKPDAAATQKKVDSFNLGLAKLAQQKGYQFLNSVEVLKDNNGYMKPAYVENDGLHFTAKGASVYIDYVRTHSYITDDTRPTLKARPTRINPPFTESSSQPEQAPAEAPVTATPSPTPTATPTASPTASPAPTAAPTAAPTPPPAPTAAPPAASAPPPASTGGSSTAPSAPVTSSAAPSSTVPAASSTASPAPSASVPE